jgi:hypothetical protein
MGAKIFGTNVCLVPGDPARSLVWTAFPAGSQTLVEPNRYPCGTRCSVRHPSAFHRERYSSSRWGVSDAYHPRRQVVPPRIRIMLKDLLECALAEHEQAQ